MHSKMNGSEEYIDSRMIYTFTFSPHDTLFVYLMLLCFFLVSVDVNWWCVDGSDNGEEV